MDLNIKGVIHVDFRKFKTVGELVEFCITDDNLRNVRLDQRSNFSIDYYYFFDKWDEIWIVNNYLIAKKESGSKQIEINSDLTRFLLDKSFNYVDIYNKEKEKEEKIKNKEHFSNLNIDSILDRISQIGFENITEEEKEFLKNNG